MICKATKQFLPLLVLWLTLGCKEKEVGTYYQVAQPILAAHCNGCHGDADVAPFSFATYEEAKSHAHLIARVLSNHTMPPFPPRTELTSSGCASGQLCRELADPRAISVDDHDALLRWAEGGTPEGTLPTTPPPDTFTRKAEEDFGPATKRLDISSEFVPEADLFETYRCFVVDPGWEVPTHVRGVAVAPGVRNVIHHSTVYVQAPEHAELVDNLLDEDELPGYDCLNNDVGLGFPTEFLLNFAPGARPTSSPTAPPASLPPTPALWCRCTTIIWRGCMPMNQSF